VPRAVDGERSGPGEGDDGDVSLRVDVLRLALGRTPDE
jgi:hypothetical protein